MYWVYLPAGGGNECVSQRGTDTGSVCVWSLPCRFVLLTMFGWGTPHVCRMRVWEILAESISWATETERERERGSFNSHNNLHVTFFVNHSQYIKKHWVSLDLWGVRPIGQHWGVQWWIFVKTVMSPSVCRVWQDEVHKGLEVNNSVWGVTWHLYWNITLFIHKLHYCCQSWYQSKLH